MSAEIGGQKKNKEDKELMKEILQELKEIHAILKAYLDGLKGS